MKVFVYGSLLKGLHNHSVLGNKKEFVGTGSIKNFAMWSISDSFPAILPVWNSVIVGEVYEVTDRTMIDLDYLEGNGHMYQREMVNVKLDSGETVKAWVYVYLNQDIKKYQPFVDNGNWKQYLGSLKGLRKVQ